VTVGTEKGDKTMKGIIIICLALFVVLTGCGQAEVLTSESSIESSEQETSSIASSRVTSALSSQSAHEIVGNDIFEGDSYVSPEISEDLYLLIPERATPVKDDAYWAALLDDVEEWTGDDTLEEIFIGLAGTLEIIGLREYDFDKIQKDKIGCYDEMIFVALSFSTYEEWLGELSFNDLHKFYKEELFDKYVYYLFNQKIDFMKVTGYSPKQAGVWADEFGYGGGGRGPEIDQIEDTGGGNYTVLMTFVDEEDNHALWKSEYKFTVEGRRIIVNSIEILEIYDQDWF